jgi:bacteriocin biosynthesis cyclodehydratase domain-containing protein
MESLLYLPPGTAPLFVEGGAVVEAPDGFQVTTDPTARAVLLALSRSPRSRSDLSADLGGSDPAGALPGGGPTAVSTAVDALVAAGALQELPAPIGPSAAALWESVGVSPGEAAVTVTSRPVAVVGSGPASRRVAAALREWGFAGGGTPHGGTPDGSTPDGIATSGHALACPPPALRVVVAADPLEGRLAGVNEAALRVSAPWVLVVPAGADAWLAVFRPGGSACWACLAARLRFNRPARAFGAPRCPPAGPLSRATALGSAVAARISAAVALLAARGGVPEFEHAWTQVGPGLAGPLRRHPLDRLPHCAACGAPVSAAHPLRPSAPDADPPDHRRLVSPVTGVTRQPRMIGQTGGAYAAAVLSRFTDGAVGPTPTLGGLMLNERHVAGGKGWTPEEAARGAVFEAVEHLSGVYRPSLPTRLATAAELGDEALLPRDVDLFSEAQREGQRACPPEPGPPTALTVPYDLDPALRTRWVRAWPLGHDGPPRWFPAAAAFYGYPFEAPRFALATSNGCGAGPTPAAAAESGLYECIERDAVAVWFYNRIPRPALALEALGDPRPSRMARALAAAGRTLDLLDVTTDLGVPVVVAVTRRLAGPPGWTLGFGAAESLPAAALRAVAEIAQLLPRADSPRLPGPLPWSDTAPPEENPHLVPSGRAVPASAPTEGPAGRGLEPLTAALRGAGLRAYVIDQTHPLVGVPVVRVVVPGLVHFWRRLGAGRLYDVPVRMGWRSRPMAEADVNPLDLTL